MRGALPLLTLIAVGTLACGPAADDEKASAADVDCLDVSAQTVEKIESGLTVQGGGSLQDARAVRSGAHRSAYFVSADLEGPGLEGPGHLATWIVTELEGPGGMVLAVSGQAKEFSDWGDASTTDARATMSDPGARESQACVPGE